MKTATPSKNVPAAFYERGGGATNTGSAVIIAGPAFEKLRPSHIYIRGQLSCNRHARFKAENGLHALSIERWRETFEIYVYRYRGGNLELVAQAEGDEKQVLDALVGRLGTDAIPAILAGVEKSRHYHCRDVHFALTLEGIPRRRMWGVPYDEIQLPPP